MVVLISEEDVDTVVVGAIVEIIELETDDGCVHPHKRKVEKTNRNRLFFIAQSSTLYFYCKFNLKGKAKKSLHYL